MKKDQYCNHDCNQGRDCPVRAGTHKPAEAVLQIQEPEADIWPCVNIDVDERGNVTNAKLYSPVLPAGNHDVYPVRVPYIDEHSEAWLACAAELEKASPGFMTLGNMNGIECAVAAIRDLAARAASAQAAPAAVAVPDSVLTHLDSLLDDAAAHIYPSDLRKCQEGECTVTVASVRMGNRDERSVPLFSREQVADALAATPAADAPLYAEMLAALQSVGMDAVGVGGGENTISDSARAKVEAVLEKIGAPWPSSDTAAAAPVVLPEPACFVEVSRQGSYLAFLTKEDVKEQIDNLRVMGRTIHLLYTEQQVRALLAGVSAPAAQAEPSDNFKREVYAALGCGSEAADFAAVTCIQNLIRRESCLSAVERQFFMVATPPDEDEGETEPGEECLLNWGQDPEQYAAQFEEALKRIAPQAQADARDAEGGQ